MAYGTVNADVIGTSVTGSNLGAGNATRFKNRIINGAMVIDQRNAGASVSTPVSSAWTYFLDRWAYYCTSTGKYSVQQNAGAITPPTGFINYLGVTSLAATTVGSTDVYDIRQPIEGLNVSDLAWGTANAKTVTLSFQIYSSLTGTFGGTVTNSAQNRCYPFSYTISSANTWTSISIIIAGDTSGAWLTTNGVGIYLVFGLGVGSTYLGTAGAWSGTFYASATGSTNVVSTNAATWYVTGVQLEVGSSATGFDVVDYGIQQLMCQRYYQTVATGAPNLHAGYYKVNLFIGNVYFPVSMRTAPTVANTGGTGTLSTIGISGFIFTRSVEECYITGYTASAEL
jgi:hypothetical protein